MSSTKHEGKNSLDQQIKDLEKFLEQYHGNVTIHNFGLEGEYRNNMCSSSSSSKKELNFVVSKKLDIKKAKKTEKNTTEQKSNNQEEKDNKGKGKEKEKDSKKEQINNFQWAGEGNAYSNRLVCVSSGGDAFVFNTDNGNIIFQDSCCSGILNACAIEQTENQMFAVGGFDGAIHLKNIVINSDRRNNEGGTKKFTGHQGNVSAIQFMNTAFMISASLDSVLLLWDINSQGKIVSSYREHTSEVSGLDVNEVNGNIFATGSGDTTVKIWDIREKKACVATFQGSDSSINCVKFLPGRLSTLAAGSEDSTIRLYDLRAVRELGKYRKADNDNNSVNSIGFSKSGMILFASSTDSSDISFWNIFDEKDTPFYRYNYVGQKPGSGILKASINSDKTKIAFIDFDEVVIIK